MNELEYTYAVARIRALEGSLLTQSVIEQLMACQNETQCLQLLSEKGWGDPEDVHDPAQMLQHEDAQILYFSQFPAFVLREWNNRYKTRSDLLHLHKLP